MSPILHGLIAWLIAIAFATKLGDRRLIVIAGVAADIDGIFILIDPSAYSVYHHTFGHSIIFGVLIAVVAFFLAKNRLVTGLAALGAFSAHLLCDLVSSPWPIYPLSPFSGFGCEISSNFLGGFPYTQITLAVSIIALLLVIAVFYWKEVSPIEFFSEKIDRLVVSTFVYPFKYKCAYCGKRAFRECETCKNKICPDHISNKAMFGCRKCSEDSISKPPNL